MHSPPARPIPENDVVVGGGLSAAPQAHVQAGLGLEDGAILAQARSSLIQTEGSVLRRFRLDSGRALSVGVRAGGFYINDVRFSGDIVPDREATRHEPNASLRWGGLVSRYTLLADPSGWFVAGSVAGLLETQRPNIAVPFCSTPAAGPNCENENSGVFVRRTEEGDRVTRGRVFLGGSGGYRLALGKRTGLQLQVGMQIDAVSLAQGTPGTDGQDPEQTWGGMLPGSIRISLQLDHLF